MELFIRIFATICQVIVLSLILNAAYFVMDDEQRKYGFILFVLLLFPLVAMWI